MEGYRDIKRNKAMRNWYKYRGYIIAVAALLLVVVVVAVSISNLTKKNTGGTVVDNSENTTQDIAQSGENPSDVPTGSGESQPDTIADGTEVPTEMTTEAPTEEVTEPVREVVAEEFTNADFYNDAVIFGDSFAGGVTLYNYLESSHVISDANWTTDKSLPGVNQIPSDIGKVFIILGINDLNYEGRTIDKIMANFQELVDEIAIQAPNATVYMVSVFPITQGFEDKTSNILTNANINALNERLMAMEGVIYLDVASALRSADGTLQTAITGDGMHISKAYYPYILNLMAQLVQQ